MNHQFIIGFAWGVAVCIAVLTVVLEATGRLG